MSEFFHGGIRGLNVGDSLVPSPPVVTDGCPVCVARSEGRALTVREYRLWAAKFGAAGAKIIDELRDAPDDAPVDAPSSENAVYFTTNKLYATWYAARSGGDLYRVEPIGKFAKSREDNFDSYTAQSARIVAVVRRNVVLDRRERRQLSRDWAKADRKAASSPHEEEETGREK